MTRFPSGRVPADVWICGKCKGPNVIALADVKCPVCGHERDGCCINPGDPYPDTMGLFPDIPTTNNTTTHEFNSYPGSFTQQFNAIQPYMNHPRTFEHGAQNDGWYKPLSVYEHDIASIPPNYPTAPAFTSFGGAGSPATGTWTCSSCDATNSDLTPDFCPVCGAGR